MVTNSYIQVFIMALFCLTLCKVSKAGVETQTFMVTPNTKLETSSEPDIVLQRKVVSSQLACGHWCLRTPLCQSFNLEKVTCQQNVHKCEILSVDKAGRQDLLVKRSDFDHYSTTDPCKRLSCLNGGTCVVSKTSVSCACAVGYEGVNCQLISECVHYKNLTAANRNINHGLVSRKCDSSIKKGWYRFVGPAGSRMLDSCPVSKCDTDFQGWIQGGQPQPGEVRVKRTVCLQGNGVCCKWPKDILVTHCVDFIVYNLTPTNCYIRYCGVD